MEKIYLTPHFSLGEMTVTKTGLVNIPNVEQINQLRILCRDILEPLREELKCYSLSPLLEVHDIPLIVDSAFRSSDVNNAVGGVSTSQHLLGQAADIHCSLDSKFLYLTITGMVSKGQIHIGQCIWYRKSHFVHVSLPTPNHKNEFFIRNK